MTTAPLPLHATEPRFFALIPCAGVGARAGGTQPKQYQAVAGQPLVAHTMAAFAQVPRVAATLLVVSPGDAYAAVFLSAGATFSVAYCGGNTRALSVLNGVQALLDLPQGAGPDDWVLVHDAARCLVTPTQINALIDACQHDAVGGLLALPLPDTLKVEQAGRVAATLARADKWLAQTPQMFRVGALQSALKIGLTSAPDAITDEASAMELAGFAPRLVVGSAQNFKVTYAEDFSLAEAVLWARRGNTGAV